MIDNQVKMVVDRIDSERGCKRLRMSAVEISARIPVIGEDGKPVMVQDPHHKDTFHTKLQPSNPENDRWAKAAINGILIVTVPDSSTATDSYKVGEEYIVSIAPAPKL